MRRILFASVVLKLVLLFPATAMATTYYVDGSGADHTCTQAQTITTAKKTINGGIACLSSGDTLEIRAGSYNESINYNIPSGVNNSTRTILKKHTGDSAPTMFGTLTLALNDNITWDGINIDDAGDGNDIDDCVFINSGSNITITNADIKNCQRHGVLTGDGNGALLSNLLFSYLTVHNTGQGYLTSPDPRHHNFYIAASHFTTGPITIDHVESYNTGNPANNGTGGPSGSAGNSWGIQIYAAVPGFLDSVTVSNSYIHDNNQGIVVGSGANHKVYNNVVYNNTLSTSYGEAAITVGYGSPTNIKVYNNTVVKNDGIGGAHGISVCDQYGSCSNVAIENNVVYQNGADSIAIAGAGGTASGTTSTPNLIGIDPSFVSVSNGNFHIQTGSAATGVGTNLYSTFTSDRDGNTRPSSGAWDDGAYVVSSSGGGGTTPPPPTVPSAPQNLHIVP